MEEESTTVTASRRRRHTPADLSRDLIVTVLHNTRSRPSDLRVSYVDYLWFGSPIGTRHIGETLAAYPQLASMYQFIPPTPPPPAILFIPRPFHWPYMPYADPLTYPVPIEFIISLANQNLDQYRVRPRERCVNVFLSEDDDTISCKTLKTSQLIHLVKEDHEEACAVCLEEYRVMEMIGSLECGHKYHANCIKHWLGHKNFCPICRAPA